jgi:Protein of unknown function (DUF1579)
MRLKVWVALAFVAVCAISAVAQNQQQQMTPEQKAQMDAWMKFMTPGEGHKPLANFVGTFDMKTTMWPAPGAPPEVSTGTSVSQWVLGNRYVQENATGTFMGMPFQGIGYTGYDNGKKQYVGSWVDNFGTSLMTSTGTTADGGKTWSFKTMTTDPMTGKDMPGEMRMTIVDADHHTSEMWGPGPDGKMYKSMLLEYTRRK